jgi:hypothetical protein
MRATALRSNGIRVRQYQIDTRQRDRRGRSRVVQYMWLMLRRPISVPAFHLACDIIQWVHG